MSDSKFMDRLKQVTHYPRKEHEPNTKRDSKLTAEEFEDRLRQAKTKIGEVQENIDHISRR